MSYSTLPTDKITTVHYLDRSGEIATYVRGEDADGKVFLESGDPPADPGRVLDAEGIAKIMRQKVLDAEATHKDRQKAAKAARAKLIEAHGEKLAALEAAGISAEAAAIIVGPAPAPYSPQPFSAAAAEENLRAFGLNDEQVQRVIGGWI